MRQRPIGGEAGLVPLDPSFVSGLLDFLEHLIGGEHAGEDLFLFGLYSISFSLLLQLKGGPFCSPL